LVGSELSRKMLRIEFDKLQHAQQVQKRLMMQQQISPSQHVKAEEFAQEIITILKREIPQLKNHQPAGSQSTSDSRSPPTSQISDEPSPITTPSLSLPSRSKSQSVIKPEQDGDVPGPKRQISRKRRTRSAPSVSTIDLPKKKKKKKASRVYNNNTSSGFRQNRRPLSRFQVTQNPTTMIAKALD
jgi:hypothetical protein